MGALSAKAAPAGTDDPATAGAADPVGCADPGGGRAGGGVGVGAATCEAGCEAELGVVAADWAAEFGPPLEFMSERNCASIAGAASTALPAGIEPTTGRFIAVGSTGAAEEEAGAPAPVYAPNATTGAVLWSYATGSFVYSSPAVANGVVYVRPWMTRTCTR